MTGIRPSSLRCVVQLARTVAPHALVLACGCSFDVTPTVVARDAGSSTKWQPPSIARSNRIINQQLPDARADAESSINIITADDASIRSHDADGGRKVVDAGQPAQRPAPSAGSAASMGTPTVMKPDMPSQCMPGIYEGTFEGPVTFAVGSINSVSGSVRAELVLEPTGDSLQVHDGVMVGKDNAGIGMSATWTGRLNCQTKQLENGRHESGAWENGSTFTGTLEGTYSTSPYSVSGTWMVQSEQIPLAGGNGTWRMTLRDNPAP